MKGLVIFTSLFFFAACTDDIEQTYSQQHDSIPPKISLLGMKIDTAYLNTNYADKGVSLLDESHGLMRCVDLQNNITVNGYVNTLAPGTYTLSYTGKDKSGNQSATLTRTVHVVPNAMEFLSGNYLVSYTCTTFYRDDRNSIINSGNYNAVIKPGSRNNHFELISLNIGPQYIVPTTYLEGNEMKVDIWYHNLQRAEAKATFFNDKNGFTIESAVYSYTPEYYKCVCVFKKQLIIKTLANK